ncbi:MAG TPA: oxygen-dependent coproporphyrinogen oxidase [Gemmatimonadales bacterium]|nr:oxygen-dependent coproporphyrinogen oxidase [Gemmatimonadales bacterium]
MAADAGVTRAAGRAGAEPFRERVVRAMAELHDEIAEYLAVLDGGGAFREDRWERPGGGGGVTRVMSEGALFEKGGVNRSVVTGALEPHVAARLGLTLAPEAEPRFLATGVSLVMHPRSPRVPTVHLNVRYFEIDDAEGRPLDAWFGGGTDLTPFYPEPADAVHFHRVLRDLCARFDPTFHPRFKRWCDDYFVNAHRGGERRGVGGIFYDLLRPGSPDAGGLDGERLLDFTRAVAGVLPAAYGPIVERRRTLPWGERERRFQLLRRGRYAEFNLVHDRGTVFGLQTSARIESVLMSLPPLAAWEYAPEFAPGSFEARLQAMLEPRDWAAGADSP